MNIETYPFQYDVKRYPHKTSIICENFHYRAECTYQNNKLHITFKNGKNVPELTFYPETTDTTAHIGFLCNDAQLRQLIRIHEQSPLFEAIRFQSGLIDLLRNEIPNIKI